MIAGHTPGPWEWQTPMGEHCPWIVKGGQQAYEWEPIATLGDCTEDGPSPRSKAFREIQANARLIAAAPDLLKACADWIAWLDSDGWREDAADYEAKMLAAMRAAIVRATDATNRGEG